MWLKKLAIFNLIAINALTLTSLVSFETAMPKKRNTSTRPLPVSAMRRHPSRHVTDTRTKARRWEAIRFAVYLPRCDQI